MIIKLEEYYFNQGVYGRVFYKKDNSQKRAVKVFFKSTDKSNEHINNTFKSEVDAYNIICKNQELQNYIPKFYGQISIDKIIDKNGIEISDKYYLEYAYEMEFIEGTFRKYGNNYTTCNILKAFIEEGVANMKDCSAIIKDGKPIKIIDFSTEEFELSH